MDNTFSSNLKRFRTAKKYTQEQVAELLGVSAQSVSRWECGNTFPDVMLLPEIAKLYCITVDDLYQSTSVAYENYAQRLTSIYESSKNPDDFIRADIEFRKLIRSGNYTAEDMRSYGIIHHYMMQYCMEKALSVFDKIIYEYSNSDELVYWRTKHQKMTLLSQIGRGKENINTQLTILEERPDIAQEWACLIAAYYYEGDLENAYAYFKKAKEKFPTDGTICLWGGDICKQLKKYDEAFENWTNALQYGSCDYDTKYSIGFCYEELEEYAKAYDIWCEIADSLKKEGYEIEAAFPQKLAIKCKEKIQ